MKRYLNIIYKDVHINTHMYVQWNLRTMDTLGVRHLSFVERLSSYTLAIQLSLNQYTKTKVLFKFGSLENDIKKPIQIATKRIATCEINMYAHTLTLVKAPYFIIRL